MKDQLISFETAKLAAEKGFNVNDEHEVFYYYNGRGKPELVDYVDEHKKRGQTIVDRPYIFAPTQSLLQKWLREEHKLIIMMNCDYIGHFSEKTKWHFFVIQLSSIRQAQTLGTAHSSEPYKRDTYEQALEEGLVYTLKILENGKK